LIRLRHIRPRGLPAFVGIGSENAAHRIAIEWDEPDGDGRVREGVYIPRRDTSSTVNHLLGGRLFPGVHHPARFDVDEESDGGQLCVAFRSDDDATRVRVQARIAQTLPASSVFKSIDEASEFFRGGSVGYSFAGQDRPPDGLELRTHRWAVTP